MIIIIIINIFIIIIITNIVTIVKLEKIISCGRNIQLTKWLVSHGLLISWTSHSVQR